MVQTEDQATTVSMSVNGEDRWSGDMDGLKTSPEAAAAFVEILTDAGGGTMTYAIAQYLTDEQKQRACEAVYVPLKVDGRLPRANGCCPLGVALWPGESAACPIPYGVFDQLISLRQAENTHQDYAAVIDGASIFIANWDSGRITDLYAALGVER